METEDLEVLEADFPIPDEDSGSAYHVSSDEEQSSSQDERHQISRPSRAASHQGRSRSTRSSTDGKPQDPFRTRDTPRSQSRRISPTSSTSLQREQRQRAAAEWAANFTAPQSPSDIRTPTRHSLRSQAKRKADKLPSEVRAKRQRLYYNNEYRELLNVDIHHAVARAIPEDRTPLEESQIGSSVWTANEKDLFFSTLSRLGRDNARAIASRIGSKSEHEVQEYIRLLHQGMLDNANKNNLLDFTDLPAAFELSEECCNLLEKAAEALASRQERVEEQAEQEKWGDSWLLTADISKTLDKQRKDEAGRDEMEETLPAVNLFHLKNWLELSRRIFMNPGDSRENDNWEALAEPGETPAIRATAFNDFHSLAANITKRLISATLFCSMSRRRAKKSKAVKYAQVKPVDVEAAVKILGLNMNSKDFWVGCARRCNLKVFDDELNSYMGHEEVEQTLGPVTHRSRSRSVRSRRVRSGRRAAQTNLKYLTHASSDSEHDGSDEDALRCHESDFTSISGGSEEELTDEELTDFTESEATTSIPRRERPLKRVRAKKEAQRAREKYIEEFDHEAGRSEEHRLWTLLRQTAPYNINPEPGNLSEPLKGSVRDELRETATWRQNLEYWSQWETLGRPVPGVNFERNRKRRSRRARRRLERSHPEGDVMTAMNSFKDEETFFVDWEEDRAEDHGDVHNLPFRDPRR